MNTAENPVKEALNFERNIKVGDKCLALWTNCGNYYEGEVEVDAVNAKSFGVRLLKAVDGYPASQRLNIPNFLNTNRWSWNNRLAPKIDGIPHDDEPLTEEACRDIQEDIKHKEAKEVRLEAVQTHLLGFWRDTTSGCPHLHKRPDIDGCDANEMRPCVYEIGDGPCQIFQEILEEWRIEFEICPECCQVRPGDERVKAGMKCGFCALGYGGIAGGIGVI